jgi:hypothetical protein
MCGCSGKAQAEVIVTRQPKEESPLLNKWILDSVDRKLLVQSSIYDVYNDIIGYITVNESGNTVRIFTKNVKEVLD